MHLSAGDIAALTHANTVLLSPFAFDDAMAWRRASCKAVEACVGADGSSHVLPLASEPPIAATPDIERALAAIFPAPPWVVEALTVRRRALSLTVADWEELFDISIVRGAPFYNDVVRPHRLMAPIVMMADIGPRVLPGAITVYFESEEGTRARVERRKQLMTLLYPAFRAGIDSFLGFRRSLESLTALTEDASIGVVTFTSGDQAGRENDHFRTLMSSEPERERVRLEVKRSVRAATNLGTLADRGSPPRRAIAEVRTSACRYCITATLLSGRSVQEPMVIVALVERRGERPLGARELSKQFSLTRREVETATLLRQGLPTREIAVELGISVNTARRHVDKILLKLDVSNRTAAAAKIFGR